MIQQLFDAFVNLNEDKTLELVKFHLAEGVDPFKIIDDLHIGMIKVGDLYHEKAYYLADLIMAGIIFKEVLELNEMKIQTNDSINIEKKSTILVGTVKDDLHDIGKNLFAGMAKSAGFEVIDLGVDVTPDIFLTNYYRFKPDIIGISGILTQSIQEMKSVVKLFVNSGQRANVKIIIGGYPITSDFCIFIGADAFSKDIKEGVEICKNWIHKK